MDLRNIKIESERLLLKPVSMEYKEEIFREFQEPVTKYIYSKPPEKISQTEDFIKRSIASQTAGTDLTMAILNKETGGFLGCVGVHELDKPQIEMGVWIKASAQGNKYGREAVTALKNWADDNVEFEYIRYPVVEMNVASRKVAESLGGTVEKTYDKTMLSGKTFPMVEYWIPSG